MARISETIETPKSRVRDDSDGPGRLIDMQVEGRCDQIMDFPGRNQPLIKSKKMHEFLGGFRISFVFKRNMSIASSSPPCLVV